MFLIRGIRFFQKNGGLILGLSFLTWVGNLKICNWEPKLFDFSPNISDYQFILERGSDSSAQLNK